MMFKHTVHCLGFNIPSAQNTRDGRLAEVGRVPLYSSLVRWRGSTKIHPVIDRGIEEAELRDPILWGNKVGINFK